MLLDNNVQKCEHEPWHRDVVDVLQLRQYRNRCSLSFFPFLLIAHRWCPNPIAKGKIKKFESRQISIEPFDISPTKTKVFAKLKISSRHWNCNSSLAKRSARPTVIDIWLDRPWKLLNSNLFQRFHWKHSVVDWFLLTLTDSGRWLTRPPTENFDVVDLVQLSLNRTSEKKIRQSYSVHTVSS